MKRKVLLSFMVTIASLIVLPAQTITIIGSGTNTTTYPPNSKYFDYGWCEMLYTSEEIGAAKSITALAFDQTVNYGEGYWNYAQLLNQRIYIKEVENTTITTAAYPDPTNNGYTLVYEGSSNTIQFTLGWSTIELNQPFEYSGEGSLIVLWENRMGNTPNTVNLMFKATEMPNNAFVVHNDSDTEFPTANGQYDVNRPNIAITSALGNGEPATPILVYPANEAIKQDVDTKLEFIIGNNTDTYDLYIGTSENLEFAVLNDIAVTAGNVMIETFTLNNEYLQSDTQYFWKVVAKNSNNAVISEVRSFTTQEVIEEFYTTSFEDSLITGYTANECQWSWPTTGSANWRSTNLDAHFGEVSAGCNVWFNTGSYSLQCPRIFLRQNSRIKYWFKAGNAAVDKSLPMNVYVEISTDLGEIWSTLYVHSFENEMLEWEQKIIDLTDYNGDSTFIRFRYDCLSIYNSNYFYLDDFTFEPISENAVCQIDMENIQFPTIAATGNTYVEVPVRNTGQSDLTFTDILLGNPFTCNFSNTIPPGGTDTLKVYFEPLIPGNYTTILELSGTFEGDKLLPISASATGRSDTFFHNFDLSNDFPTGWSQIRTTIATDIFTTVSVKTSSYDAYSQPNAIKMQKVNDTISPLVFVSEGTRNFNGHILNFMLKSGHPEYDLTMVVGTMSDPYHFESFEAVQTIIVPSTYQQFSISFDATETGPYIAFLLPECSQYNSLWMDDISWASGENVGPGCPILTAPLNGAQNVDIMMDTKLKWSSATVNTAGYRISIGTNPEANSIIDNQDVGNVIQGSVSQYMTYNTTYYWKVVAYNDYGESEGCQTYSFTTMEDPTITSYPYIQNFDQVAATSGFDVPLGWSYANKNNDNFTWDLLRNSVDPTVAYSAPFSMHMVFALNTMDDYLFTCPFNMRANKEYLFTFMNRTVADAYVPAPVETLRILAGRDNSSEAMVNELYVNEELINLAWKNDTARFVPNSNGVYYFAIHGNSIANQGLLLIDDVKVEERAISGIQNPISDMNVYPNPAANRVTITGAQDAHISLISLEGKILVQFFNSANFAEINTEHFSSGVYLVQIRKNDIVRQIKLIVNK